MTATKNTSPLPMEIFTAFARGVFTEPLTVIAFVVASFVWLVAHLGSRVLSLIERLASQGKK
jgi:hypothetical protein